MIDQIRQKNVQDASQYDSFIEYFEYSVLLMKTLYNIMCAFSVECFGEEHMRFLKADGYETLISDLLPFTRLPGVHYYDVVAEKWGSERISIKTQESIFQAPTPKGKYIKRDKNGNLIYTEPKELVMVNSMGGQQYNSNDFDHLLAIQTNPFAIGLATSSKCIKNGEWKGENKDQFRTRLYNHNMCKMNGKKRKIETMTKTDPDSMYDLYREMPSQYKTLACPSYSKERIRAFLRTFYHELYETIS